MSRSRNRGCLPWALGLILIVLWLSGEEDDWEGPPLAIEQFDPESGRSPRRPMPDVGREVFVIEDPGPKQDSQGTAFAIDTDGVWLTAEHVTHDCDRLGVVEPDQDIVLVGRVLESREADASLLRDGPPASAALALGAQLPRPGDTGFHMGFPAGEPTVVASTFLGVTQAERGPGSGRSEPIYAWAESRRLPDRGGALGGISGGPTFDREGRVIGINSASTPRRGRVLTTEPDAILRLVRASGQVDDRPGRVALDSDQAADAAFRQWVREGVIAQVYCDVS